MCASCVTMYRVFSQILLVCQSYPIVNTHFLSDKAEVDTLANSFKVTVTIEKMGFSYSCLP